MGNFDLVLTISLVIFITLGQWFDRPRAQFRMLGEPVAAVISSEAAGAGFVTSVDMEELLTWLPCRGG